MGYAITSKGQVTLPKAVRERLGVRPGEEVQFRLNDQGEVVIEKGPGGTLVAARASRWRGFFGPGPSTDEILAMTRGEAAEAE
ncbi:MAG: AbrB/MazE/SpoVT family DNA-binding domain-containing protein [Rhodospirillales bacterium]